MDALANIIARMSPLRDDFSIEIIYNPFILDNITNLRVFYDDQQIPSFMENANIFKDATIDEEEHEKTLQDAANASKGNLIPKGVMSLEKLYNLQNRFQGPVNAKTHRSTLSHEHINLGIDKDLKYVNLGTCCTWKERQAFIHLFK